MAPELSNYPPGVFGNEPEIAGCPESEEFRVCASLECDFEGVVTVCFGAYDTYWDCPTCGHENGENIIEYYDDPDSGRYEDDYFDEYDYPEMDCGV